ncbi:MAG: class I SAM-dependent methyltransferase [Ktedonobacterales bacterium]|nr:class I SAM-dependent methyltransferase [Ktedonobacterales bacterium]
MADRYDASRGYPPDVAERIAEAFLRAGQLAAGGSVLEIGIGTGRIALPLLARGVHVTGVDISQRMLDQLRGKYDALRADAAGTGLGTLTARVADMTALPFPDGGFDAVIAVHVLHLVPEWRRALDEALRVVRADGALLLGQDIHNGSDASRVGEIQDQWRAILRELGYGATNVGATGFDAVLAEVRQQGLAVEETLAATWETTYTPRVALESITTRLWSGSWTVPDDLFAESTHRLTAWAERHYAGTLDTPLRATHAFKLARVAPST